MHEFLLFKIIFFILLHQLHATIDLPGQELLGCCFFPKSTSEQFPCTAVFFILTSFKPFNLMLPDWLSQSDKKTKQFYSQSSEKMKVKRTVG